MQTEYTKRLAELDVIIERTEKSLKELAKTLAALPEDDP